jgi:hypothetical protein
MPGKLLISQESLIPDRRRIFVIDDLKAPVFVDTSQPVDLYLDGNAIATEPAR